MKNTFLELTPVQYNSAATKVLHFNIPPHCKCFRIHWHDRIELLRIKSGKIYVELGTDLIIASTGELMIIPPKTLHTAYTLAEHVEYDVLMFDIRSFYNETELCKKTLPAVFDGKAVFKTVTSHSETIRCIDFICKDGNHGTLETISKIYQLIDLFFKNELLEFRLQSKNAIVKKMIDYIEENATQEINIAMLCEKFGYTAGHLCRKFKQTTGLPPMTYLKIYRLELAHKKLKDPNANISEIASKCGFSDANYFSRCFKSHFSKSPSQYKKECRQ